MNNFRGLLSELQIPTNSGLENKFKVFKSNIELTDTQKKQIQSSHAYLRTLIERQNYVSNTFLTGSYKKNTMIRPIDDVDLFVVVNNGYTVSSSPQTVLNQLKKDLKVSFPKTSIKQNKPCIIVDFNHCKFEITPTITNLWGSYEIPLDSYSWKSVDDPRILENKLSVKNSQLNNRLIPLIKMMKKCARHCNIDSTSYLLEELALNLYQVNSYRDGIQKLLEIYQWKDTSNPNYYSYIKNMTDNEFAYYCRNTLFGQEFPG